MTIGGFATVKGIIINLCPVGVGLMRRKSTQAFF